MAITLTPIGGEGEQYKIEGLPAFILDKTADDLTKALTKLQKSIDKNESTAKKLVDSASGRSGGGVKDTFAETKKTANEFAKTLKEGNKTTATYVDTMRLTNAQSMFNIKSFGRLAASAGAAAGAIAGIGFSLLGMAVKYSTTQFQKFAGVLEASMQNGTLFALAVDDFATRLATEATAMGMSFDELVGTLNTFGDVTVLGAKEFTSLIRVAQDINSPLIALGMSSAEAAEIVGRESQFRMNQIGVIRTANKTFQDSVIESSERAVHFAQVLGVSTTEFMTLRHNAIETSDAFIGLARGSIEARNMQLNSLIRFADEVIKMGGEVGSQLASAFIDAAGKGALGFSDAAVGFVRALPQLNGVFQDVLLSFRTGQLDAEQTRAKLEEIMGNQSESTRQRLFLLARAGDQSAAQLIQMANQFERSQRTISLFGVEVDNATKMQVERFGEFQKSIESVRALFGNFAIQMFSSEIFLKKMNEALNNVIMLLIPGANVKGNFADTLKANAEKIEEAAIKFGEALGDQLIKISAGVKSFIESFYSPQQKMQAAARDEAQARKARIDGEMATVQDALKNGKFRDDAQQQALQERLNRLKASSDAEAKIIEDNSENLPGLFDVLGSTIANVIGVFEQLADKLMMVIGILGALALGPVMGPLFRGGRALFGGSSRIGNRGIVPTGGATGPRGIQLTQSGMIDKRTAGYRNLPTSAQNIANRGPAGSRLVAAANSSSKFMNVARGSGPLALGISGIDLGYDIYKSFSGDPKEMMGRDLLARYEAQAEATGGGIGASIGALGFLLGPVGFITTAAGQMIGNAIGNAVAVTEEQIDKMRADNSNPLQARQYLTDNFLVPFGMSADHAISTASEGFADILMQSMTMEDAYIDQEIARLRDQAMSSTGDAKKRALDQIDILTKRKDEMFKNVAAQQGIDMDAVYEEGSKEQMAQQAILKAQNEDNALDLLSENEKQTYYLRKMAFYMQNPQ